MYPAEIYSQHTLKSCFNTTCCNGEKGEDRGNGGRKEGKRIDCIEFETSVEGGRGKSKVNELSGLMSKFEIKVDGKIKEEVT